MRSRWQQLKPRVPELASQRFEPSAQEGWARESVIQFLEGAASGAYALARSAGKADRRRRAGCAAVHVFTERVGGERNLTHGSSGLAPFGCAGPSFHSGPSAAKWSEPLNLNVRLLHHEKSKMYQAHRRYQICIFCDRVDLTKEHIFGKAFARHIRVRKHWVGRHPRLDGRPVLQIKGSCPITDIAPRLLCKVCNSILFAPMMAKSLPWLTVMADGSPATFGSEDIKTLKAYFVRLAIILDVCSSNEQLDDRQLAKSEFALDAAYRKQNPAIAREERKAWVASGYKTSLVDIRIGCHKGVLGLNPSLFITHWLEIKSGCGKRPMKRVCFVLKDLAVCIDLGALPKPVPASFVDIELLREWPPANFVSYEDFFELPKQDLDLLMTKAAWSNIFIRTELEKQAREEYSSGLR